MVGILLTGGLAACVVDADREPEPTLAGQSQPSAPTVSADDPGVLGAEARNYVELHQLLATATGSALLDDSGPADGPAAGFKKVATVTADGPHTVTAACVGIPHVQIYLSQDTKAGTEHMVFEVDCSRTQTQAVQLQKGYVSAQLTRNDPTDAWTGAVAGIKITVQ
ncbi:hypothetical protein NKCBBBOE_02025 [Pseudarthrobacter sp. MM222]|nr:hypothetical protein NKCBBBOE_02025 [Pseudarthrobacter sp. MM222]